MDGLAQRGQGRFQGGFGQRRVGVDGVDDLLEGLMRTIKAAIDPRGLLNPGKVL